MPSALLPRPVWSCQISTAQLDMGQPVRILDLATDLIKLSGLEPERDIKIVYTGIRPGEKLNEELFLEEEDCRRTKHSNIFIATDESAVEAEMLEQVVIELVNLTRRMQSQNATEQMRVLLPQVCYCIDNHQPRPQPLLPEPTAHQHQPVFVEPAWRADHRWSLTSG